MVGKCLGDKGQARVVAIFMLEVEMRVASRR